MFVDNNSHIECIRDRDFASFILVRWRTREEPGFSLVDMQSSAKIKPLLTFCIQFWCYNFKYIYLA